MHGIPEVTWNDVQNWRNEYLPWSEERLIVDSTNGVEENLERAIEYINRIV